VISTWECKAHYGFWRPITAIRNADADGNDDTFADEEWTPLAVGGSPEYSSGLAAFGGAGRAVLAEYFGDETPFDLTRRERSRGPLADDAVVRLVHGRAGGVGGLAGLIREPLPVHLGGLPGGRRGDRRARLRDAAPTRLSGPPGTRPRPAR